MRNRGRFTLNNNFSRTRKSLGKMMEPLWTQQQTINSECAREVITDSIGILSAQIYAETDSIKLRCEIKGMHFRKNVTHCMSMMI